MVEETGVPLKDIKSEKIAAVLEELYGLKIISSPEALSSSVDTSVWKVDFENKQCYAKFYLTSDYSFDLTQDEAKYYDFLIEHGVNVPFVYQGKNGEKVHNVKINDLDLAIFLMRCEDLKVLSLDSITKEEVITTAKAIANMSKVAMDYPYRNDLPDEKVTGIPEDLIENLLKSPNKSEFSDEELKKVIATYEDAQKYLDQNPVNFEELTNTVLHSDLMLNHAPLLPNGEVYFFDFADRWFGPVTWDLAIMLNNLYRGGVISIDRWEELQKWFYEGYVPEIGLKEVDYKALKSFMILHCVRGTNYLNNSAIKLGRTDGAKGIRKSWIIVDYLLNNELVFHKLVQNNTSYQNYNVFQNIEIKDIRGKGKGVFAGKDFKKGEMIFEYDLLKNAKQVVTLEEAKDLNEYESNHLASIGDGKYVVDLTPVGIVNHSCDPNVYEEFEDLTKGQLIAIKDIKKGEEINKDYTHAAVDQIDNAMWEMECNCHTSNCRKVIHGDFFKMPVEWQKENVQYLPTYLKKKYSQRIVTL